MRRSSLRWRLWIGMAGFLLALGAVLLFLSYRSLEKERLSFSQRSSFEMNQIAFAWLTEKADGWEEIEGRLSAVAQAFEVEVLLYDTSGDVRARVASPNWAAPGLLGVPTSVFTREFDLGGDLQGKVEIRARRDASTEGRKGLCIGGLVAIAAALFGSWLFAASSADPMEDLAAALDALGQGDPRSRFPEFERDDEVGDLIRGFGRAYDRVVDALADTTRDRDQLDIVLSGMPEGVLAVDGEEHLVHVNSAALDILRVSKEPVELLGLPILRVTREPHVLHAVTEVLEEKREVLITYTRACSGAPGEQEVERTIELTARRLQVPSFESACGGDSGVPCVSGGTSLGASVGEAGCGAGAVVVLHDITRLERLEGLRRDFVSNVSHELKTPLTAIRGFVETLLDTDDVDETTRQRFLTRVKVQTSRLSALVGDLLSLSRIESGNMEVASSPLNVYPIVAETLLALRPEAEAQEVSVAFQREVGNRQTDGEVGQGSQPVLVFAEAEALRQAFSNLVGNAIKYSEPGGSVRVRLGTDEKSATFEVEDSGPGIAEEHLERIFERFYRVDKARARALGGTGLGLAIVKNVATALGGRVEVASELGVGSTFRMVLPLAGCKESGS